jgi:hypothetical protein
MASLLLLALLGASAHNQQPLPVAAPEAAAEAVAQPRERRICRTNDRLGTIIQRRVCRTASGWAAIDREQERITASDMAHMRDHRRTSMWEPGDPSGP